MLVGDISSRNSPTVMSQPQSSEISTPDKSQCPDNGENFTYFVLLTNIDKQLDMNYDCQNIIYTEIFVYR